MKNIQVHIKQTGLHKTVVGYAWICVSGKKTCVGECFRTMFCIKILTKNVHPKPASFSVFVVERSGITISHGCMFFR